MKLKLAILALAISSQCVAEVNADRYGKNLGYPFTPNQFLAEQDKFVISEYSGARFEDQNRIPEYNQEKHWVRKPQKTIPLPKASVDWGWVRNPDSWVKNYPILSIVVYKEGKIIYEKYQYDRRSDQRYRGQSMAKTLTAIAIGIAVDENKVQIDDPAEKYLPQLTGTPLGKVTVRNHLKMASGSGFKYDVKGDARRYYLSKFASEKCGLDYCGIDVTDTWKKETQVIEQGKIWNYDPQSSDILSAIITAVYKKPLSKVWEEKVWSKLGPEKDAVWRSVNYTDITSGANYFLATPADWIRISRIWFDNNNIVSKSWLDQMSQDTVSIEGHQFARWSRNNNPDRYGYQIWVRDGKWISMAGHRGQKLFIDPKSKTSMFVSSVQGDWTKDGIEWFEWLTRQSLDSLIK